MLCHSFLFRFCREGGLKFWAQGGGGGDDVGGGLHAPPSVMYAASHPSPGQNGVRYARVLAKFNLGC